MEYIKDKIYYLGVKTNNLKNFNVDIPKNNIICIYGKSGSGKSSLAFGTIHAISQYELSKLENRESFAHFNITNYKNIISSIAIKQHNKNNNPLSTVYSFTYIGIQLKKIFSYYSDFKMNNFSFNNPKNLCEHCNGYGVTTIPHFDYIIDDTISLKDFPIKYYNSNRQKIFNQKLIEFCHLKNIDINKKFCQLNEEEKNKILYDNTGIKIDVKYTKKLKSGKKTYRNRKETFIGVFTELEELLHSGKIVKKEFFCDSQCIVCKGSRFNHHIRQIKVFSVEIEKIVCFEILELQAFLITSKKLYAKDNQINTDIIDLINFLKIMIDNNIGYLNLTRTIPSLSGGEFQKLHFSSILNSSLTDHLYVMDEISANLHISEYENIWMQIKNIQSKGNTVILVEHQKFFIDRSHINIEIGPGSGVNGGKIIDENIKIPLHKTTNLSRKKIEINHFLEFTNINKNNIKDLNIKLPAKCLICICGISGSGKSSLASYLSENNKNFIYINQNSINSPTTSIVASFLEIFSDIREIFAEANHVDKSFFSFNLEMGQCENCKGKGNMEEKISFSKETFSYTCPICEGRRFKDEILNYLYKGYTIYELLNLSIEEILINNIFSDRKKIIDKLYLCQEVGLEYLTLFRSTKDISGGESQRLKIIKYINSIVSDKFFIFDEPLRGIDAENSHKIIALFDKLIKKKATVLMIEHKIQGIINSDWIIELNGTGKTGGKIIFEGTSDCLYKSNNSLIAKYLPSGDKV